MYTYNGVCVYVHLCTCIHNTLVHNYSIVMPKMDKEFGSFGQDHQVKKCMCDIQHTDKQYNFHTTYTTARTPIQQKPPHVKPTCTKYARVVVKHIVEVQRIRNKKCTDRIKLVVRLSQWASPMVL